MQKQYWMIFLTVNQGNILKTYKQIKSSLKSSMAYFSEIKSHNSVSILPHILFAQGITAFLV